MEPAPDVRARIQALLEADRVVLFMKGLRYSPQCGFSKEVVERICAHIPAFAAVDVLEDPALREGVKAFSDWPTLPQLYVAGEFVGGCDIVRELDEGGELGALLRGSADAPDRPSIELTPAARAVFAQALAESDPGDVLRILVPETFVHDLEVGAPEETDVRVMVDGLPVAIPRDHLPRAAHIRVDYVEKPQTGFRIDNAAAPPRIIPLTPAQAADMVSGEFDGEFVDVRTVAERREAVVSGSRLLDQDELARLSTLPRERPMVFICHHGVRSRSAAAHFLELGFRRVYNVEGGIDAWSQDVDPQIPRY